MRSGQGNPDEARAARYILKDFVNGKLLFCHPPPGISESSFNKGTHELAMRLVAGKKRAPVTRVGKGADTFVPPNVPLSQTEGSILSALGQGSKSRALDSTFFEGNSGPSSKPFVQGSIRNGKEFTRAKIFPHQHLTADDGTFLGERRDQVTAAVTTDEFGKRHYKKHKHVKQRSGKGYDQFT
jgi:large subunit GTPase 1